MTGPWPEVKSMHLACGTWARVAGGKWTHACEHAHACTAEFWEAECSEVEVEVEVVVVHTRVCVHRCLHSCAYV